MRVVVTRPKDRAQGTAAALQARGHQPLLLPLSEARHRHDDAAGALSRSHRAIAITSAEAIRALGRIDLAPHLATPLFAVGRKTALAARTAGFTDIRVADGDGSSLAQLVATHQIADLLYLTGLPRAPMFEDALSRQATSHTVAEVYEMVPLMPDASDIAETLQPQADAVLFHSRDTARLFFSLPAIAQAPDALTPRLIACLSPRVADAVPSGLRDRTRIAARPEEAALLALL